MLRELGKGALRVFCDFVYAPKVLNNSKLLVFCTFYLCQEGGCFRSIFDTFIFGYEEQV